MSSKKFYKKIKLIVVILISILLIEFIYFGIKIYTNRKNTTYYTTTNSIIKDGNKFVSVGLSDFKNSKLTKYETPGYNKPAIWVYDEKYNVTKEIKYKDGFNGVFYDILKISDGYLLVGAIEPTKNMHEDGLTEGLIVKYDKDFNIVWEHNLQVLDTTKLVKVKIDKNENIIAVGESVYASDILGNHTTGGAILVIYNKDGEKQQIINYGGPKTGIFNDIEVLEDGYVVVGLTSTNTGIIIKYDKKGKEVWHNYYGYTDSKGLTSINYVNKTFIVTASKLLDKTNTDTYKGAIIKFDSKGKLLKEQTYEKDNISRIEKTINIDDKIYAIALYGQKKDNILVNQSAILRYNKDLELEKEEVYEGNKTVTFTKIIENNDSLLVAGYTNSKIEKLKTNGYDYYNLLINYDKDLKQK